MRPVWQKGQPKAQPLWLLKHRTAPYSKPGIRTVSTGAPFCVSHAYLIEPSVLTCFFTSFSGRVT